MLGVLGPFDRTSEPALRDKCPHRENYLYTTDNVMMVVAIAPLFLITLDK